MLYWHPMNIGVCRIRLRLPENGTLKGKRQAYRSITTKVRQKYNVSIAEVEDNDNHHLLTLGVTCVSNDSRHANEVVSHVGYYVETLRGDTELLDYETEIMAGV